MVLNPVADPVKPNRLKVTTRLSSSYTLASASDILKPLSTNKVDSLIPFMGKINLVKLFAVLPNVGTVKVAPIPRVDPVAPLGPPSSIAEDPITVALSNSRRRSSTYPDKASVPSLSAPIVNGTAESWKISSVAPIAEVARRTPLRYSLPSRSPNST